jgi:putative ABC transport system permease protein
MKLLPASYATRNLGRSPVRLLLSVGSAALVALLAMAGTGFATGMDRALRASGHPRNVLLLGAGSEESVERSEVPRAVADSVAAGLPAIGTWDGRPLASPEINVALTVAARGTGAADAGVGAAGGAAGAARPGAADDDAAARTGLVRGITPAAFLVHPQVQVVAGRAPESGANEVALGISAARSAGLEPAEVARALAAADAQAGVPAGGAPAAVEVLIDGRPFRVTGLLSAPGTVMDGEAWAPLDDVLVLTQRETVSGVVIGLAPGAEPGDVEAFAQRRIDLELSAIHEPAYYASQSAFYRPVRVMVLASAALVAAGALLGGLGTMYAAFAGRIRELAMLQVLGYGRAAISASMLQEAMVASLAGALLAVGIAMAFVDGISIRFSMGTFGIRIDEAAVAVGLAAGALVGAAGCVAPAVRCLRVPLTVALKSD